MAIWLRTLRPGTGAPDLALNLIARSPMSAPKSWGVGFLATPAAGVGLRRTELHTDAGNAASPGCRNPAPPVRGSATEGQRRIRRRRTWSARRRGGGAAEPSRGRAVAKTISFRYDTVKRLVGLLLVVLVGVCLDPLATTGPFPSRSCSCW